MEQVTYEAVLKQAEQLTPQEQQALIEHLQMHQQEPELDFDTWLALFNSLKVNIPVLKDFSNRRVDWY
ncbi:MAG: hypothetical protein H7X77_08130 [Anaerolineae bacterium]|nr:hypothetical protein [Anaerolineae bacterium]